MGFEDPFVAELLFAGFDQDRDGVVNFKEFLTSLSTLTRGTPDEKIECAYYALKITFSSQLSFSNFLFAFTSHLPHV